MNTPGTPTLIPTKGTPHRGGGPGGEAWRIDQNGTRAGVVFINKVDQPPLGHHASIQIFLNAKSRGRGIGRQALQQACLASRHSPIYAHISKKNIASQKAFLAAGFTNATPPGHRQLIFHWQK
jgi:RimJ/RimL family protein N-acetyltransferase